MAAGTRLRSAVLFGGLALTLAATAWVAQQEEPADELAPLPRDARAPARPAPAAEAAPAAPRNAPAEAAASAAVEIDLERLRRAAHEPVQEPGDAFARHSWYVPPPPPKPVPPPKPKAPALPFKFMGRLVEDGRDTVFLTGAQDRTFAVTAGDRLPGNYRVDTITEKQMTLTYLPLNQQQTLSLAGGR